MGDQRHLNTCFYPRPRFWENLTSPLFGTLSPPSETSEVSSVEGRAEALRKGPCLRLQQPHLQSSACLLSSGKQTDMAALLL